MSHIHILGVCGTFMGGVARLGIELGHRVSGCDAGIYPPMSDQLQSLGVELHQGYEDKTLNSVKPDLVIIGNALSRGNPAVEAVLNSDVPFVSGPRWLADTVLEGRWVLAVAGTHGKTTTASILTWILDRAGLNPGYLIGGIPENFGVSARLGTGDCFVVEADEYDSAFFDKRPKFIHYRPRTLIMNNLEFDHADIFSDIEAIKLQFQYLIRTVPGMGRILSNVRDPALDDVIAAGCWTPVEYFGTDPARNAHWHARGTPGHPDRITLWRQDNPSNTFEGRWPLFGEHNISNAVAAVAAASHAGVDPAQAVASLTGFKSVRRRLDLVADVNGIRIYDDFAHHPTAIERTLEALRGQSGVERIIAVLEPRSNTMRAGVHGLRVPDALKLAHRAFVYRPQDSAWDISKWNDQQITMLDSTADIISEVTRVAKTGDTIVVMTNGGFENFTRRLVNEMQTSSAH